MRRIDIFGSPRSTIIAIVAVAFLASPLQAEGLASAQELVEQCVEAYGGAKALRGLQSWQQIGKITSPMRGEGVMVRVFVPPDRLRVETRFGDESGEIRILNGEQGWRSGQEVEGPPYLAMVLQAARLSLPRILLEGREHIRDVVDVERDGRQLKMLRLELQDGQTLEIELDPATGRIERSRSLAGPLVFETQYGDFREVDGVLFPFVETTWAMGQKTGRFELERVVLNDPIRDRIFLP